MAKPEIQILLSPEAEGEFEAIQLSAHPLQRGWAKRYLEEMLDFPPEAWVDLRRRAKGLYFKSDSHVPFDIQGRVYEGPGGEVERVVVTRFRARRGTWAKGA